MVIMTTTEWAPGKRRLYEVLLETLDELDFDQGTDHARELAEAVDTGIVEISHAPRTSVLRDVEGAFEYRGKLINFPLHTRPRYFLWYIYDTRRDYVLVNGVGAIKPSLFP